MLAMGVWKGDCIELICPYYFLSCVMILPAKRNTTYNGVYASKYTRHTMTSRLNLGFTYRLMCPGVTRGTKPPAVFSIPILGIQLLSNASKVEKYATTPTKTTSRIVPGESTTDTPSQGMPLSPFSPQ